MRQTSAVPKRLKKEAYMNSLHQRANTSKPTREKGRRLIVTQLTTRFAFVEGDTETYTVWFNGLSCSCEAGVHGLRCSHVQAAIRERARTRGRTHVMFAHSLQHALSFAALQRARGRVATVYHEHRYIWCEYGPLPENVLILPPPKPRRNMAELQADVDELVA
jgi:hypothetical protein